MPGRRTPGSMCQVTKPVRVEDGTSARAAAPAPVSSGVPVGRVEQWDVRTKLLEAARRAAPKLPKETREQFEALFSPLNIGVTGGVLAVWGASHFFGVGEAADVIMLLVGVVTTGTVALGAARDLADYFTTATRARSDADLDRAANSLARAVVTIGVTAFIAMIMKAGAKIRGRVLIGRQAALKFDLLAEEMLQRVMGSNKNVGILPRQNMRLIVEFFDKHNVADGNLTKWAELIRGIDLHGAEPVRVTRFLPGDLVGEYVETGRPVDRQVGQWMVRARGAVSDRNLGLSGAGRQYKVYRVTKVVEVLESKAAPAADHWTTAGSKPHTAVTVEDGGRVMKPAEQVSGGGKQYFLPRAWEFLQPVAPAPE